MLSKDISPIERRPDLPKAMDYSFLRTFAMERIKAYSKDLWTDYNDHDPGITLMQLLSFAITDISRRARFPVEDLLAGEDAPAIDRDRQFFTASEILTTAPVTINDYRKLLADQPGVRNAWLKTTEGKEPAIYINPKQERLQYHEGEELDQLAIRGLYRIKLELEQHPELGDLNSFTETIQIESGRPDQGEIIVQLPHWDVCRPVLHPVQTIETAEIKTVESTGRFTFSGKITINSTDFSFSGRTSIGETDPDLIKERMDDEELPERYAKKLQHCLSMVNGAMQVLHNHRNLCEDFLEPEGIRIEEIGVCADIVIAPNASRNEIMAGILYRLERLIAPPIRFYSLRDLQDRGTATEQIFNGPVLAHGFVDDDELEASNPKPVIYVSDLVKEIMGIEGVEAVESISIASMIDGAIRVRDAEWCLHIAEGRFPRFDSGLSKILLFKEGIPYRPDAEKVAEHLAELKASDRKEKPGAVHYDLPIPEGRDRSILAYTPLQNDLPKTYGVGEYGLDEPLAPMRKAQIKQLRAFLVFFDQILVNYLAQLSRTRELFSFSAKTKRTYFNAGLMSAPDDLAFTPLRDHQYLQRDPKGVDILLFDFIEFLADEGDESVDVNNPETYRQHWNHYKELAGIEDERDSHYLNRLNEISESPENFSERRNRFLDHLLARFGEQFTDYAILMHNLTENRASARLIEDKIRFLKEIPELSSSRAKAMNYNDADGVWDSDNVATVLKRVARLLGIEPYHRRNLTCDDPDSLIERYQDSSDKWRFRIPHDDLGVILRSTKGFDTEEKLDELLQQVYEYGGQYSGYKLRINTDESYTYDLTDTDGDTIATGRKFTTRDERENAIGFLVKTFSPCNKEGFYLVEHLLLRPQKEGDLLMPVCLRKDNRGCPGFRDPYSFRISIIIPSWPERFRQMEFRRYTEQTFRRELPAHVHAKICWAGEESLKPFETAWKEWLTAKSDPAHKDLSAETQQLIEAMAGIRSVYPSSTLFDCNKQGDRPALLDNSIIGTFKPDEL